MLQWSYMNLNTIKKYIPQPIKHILIKTYVLGKRRFSFLKRLFVTPKIPMNPEGKIYLNLGCAGTSGPEFINIDIEPHQNIHYIQDITDLSNFSSDSVDMVYASHVLEHIPRDKFDSTLREWKRVLKKGGVLRFAVPHFDALVDIYEKTGKKVEMIRDQVLGQNPPYNNHYTLWNFDYARDVLEKHGFSSVHIWNANEVDHHNFTDRASRTMRVGDEDVLFSLNIEAKKI